MKQFEINVTRSLFLTEEDIDCIMSSALDWISYWCEKAEVVGDYLGEYASEQIARGGVLKLYDAEDDEVWELTPEKFLDGFKQWYDEGCDRYGAVQPDGTVETGQIDGPMADLIVQFGIFGEEVYA